MFHSVVSFMLLLDNIFFYITVTFPTIIQEFITKFLYNCINLFSNIQLFFIKNKKKYNELIDRNPSLYNLKKYLLSLFKTKINNIEFIKNGFAYNEIIDNYDLIIYSDNENGESTQINKKIIRDLKTSYTYELSKIKFIMVELQIKTSDNKTHQFIIDLSKNNNFYIVDNKLDLAFFNYYAKTFLNFDSTNETVSFYINLIDNKAHKFLVDLTLKSILIEKNDYKFINVL